MSSAKRTSFVLTMAVTAVFFCVATAHAGKPDKPDKPGGGGGGSGGGGTAYDIIPFAPFDLKSTNSEVADVNEMGTMAVGDAILPSGEHRAAHLNIASGVYTTFADGIELNGINNHNQMVGEIGGTGAFWDGVSASPVLLPSLSEDTTVTSAYRINDAGVIIGEDSSGVGVLWLVADGIVADGPLPLPSLPGDSGATGWEINELQGGLTQVVGQSRDTSGSEAVVWTIEVDEDSQFVAPTTPQALGTLNLGDPTSSWGTGINNSADVVGGNSAVVVGGSNTQPFFVEAGAAMDQLPLTRKATTGLAWDINDADDIVGHVNIPPNGSASGPGWNWATLWKEGEPTYLETLIDRQSGWEHLLVASEITNNGVIAGKGYFDIEHRGFLMIPNATSASIGSVPEPGTLALAALGLLGLATRARRTRRSTSC
jgi:hypothetical protein